MAGKKEPTSKRPAIKPAAKAAAAKTPVPKPPPKATRPAAAPPPTPPPKPRKPVVAFAKKNQPPTAAAFAARLPLPLGRRFEMVRTYLVRHKGVTEEVYFYGPNTGWALRYLYLGRPLCSLHLHDERPVGIVSLDPASVGAIDWKAISPLGQKARKNAHGSPARLWLDLLLEGTGASDFKAILRAKVAVMPASAAAGAGAADGRDGAGAGDDGSADSA